MSAYNLYLLDESRDPRVIARLARVTGLPEQIVRRELRRPPFLVLREHALSQAVAVRRELEQLGLSFRLERVETPSGGQQHPLAGELAPEDGAEIVLEEGAGFTALPEGDPAAPGEPLRRRAFGFGFFRRAPGRVPLLALLALLAALGGWWALRPAARDPELRALTDVLGRELPLLTDRLERTLAAAETDPQNADSLVRLVDDLERLVRPVWDRLSRRQRGQVEDLLARRQTLVLRRADLAAPSATSAWTAEDLRQPASAGVAGEDFWRRLAVQWGRQTAPADLGEQLALERLDDEVQRIANGSDADAQSRLLQLSAKDPEGRRRVGALRLAGSLRQKGVAWTGEGELRQGWVDLPDSTALDVAEERGTVHQARVMEGRLVFEQPPGELSGVSVRLAALERQPAGLRRMLEAGLLLLSPDVYYATLPGSRLPRLNAALAEAQWQRGGDPALKAELKRLGLGNEDLRHPVLERDAQEPGGLPDLGDWLRAAADQYRRARVWPAHLELRTPTGRYRLSGCELWHLTQGGGVTQ